MKSCLVLMSSLLALGLWAAPKFDKVPAAAQTALSGIRGKSVDTGLVFANGHFIKPSYKVARYGTAVFVNETQVTGQIVPWRAFLDAQDGASPRPVARPKPAAPAPAPAAKPVAAKSVDDLFDDDDSKPAAPAANVAPEKPAAAAPAAEDDEGAASFTPNDQTKKLLERINTYRTSVNRRLLQGYVCFFGSRYAPVYVPARMGRQLINVLPEAIRDANDAADLLGVLRQKGFAFMTRELCEDLIGNRADYPALQQYRAQLEEDEKLRRMATGAGRGGMR